MTVEKNKITSFSRLRLDHTAFILIKRSNNPTCDRCKSNLIIKHALDDGPGLSHLRQTH